MSANPIPLRPAQQTRSTHREPAITKAARLLSGDRVKVDKDAKVYIVEGDSDVYRVIASPDGILCPCPARNPLCSHMIAVAMIRQRGQADPDRLAADLGVAS